MNVYEAGAHWGKSGAGERRNGAGTGRAGAGAGGFDLEEEVDGIDPVFVFPGIETFGK